MASSCSPSLNSFVEEVAEEPAIVVSRGVGGIAAGDEDDVRRIVGTCELDTLEQVLELVICRRQGVPDEYPSSGFGEECFGVVP